VVAAVAAAATVVHAETARGVVFDDRNGNEMRDDGEPGLEGIAVSNGRDVIRTGADGSWELPVEDGTILFVTKPPGRDVPLDEHNLPRFFYIHRPEGTPETLGLRFAGIDPTGPLPDSIDFPLRTVQEDDRYDVIWFADPQPQTEAEVGFIRDDVVAELVGIEAEFGITAGDIMYDDLSLYPRYNEVISQIGIPWYNIPGNHDLNYRAPNDRLSLETFKRYFGPPYYSFEFGQVHYIVLDDVHYLGEGKGRDTPHPRDAGAYEGRIGARQLEWLKNDLALVPESMLVVVAMHIPFSSYKHEDHPRRGVVDRSDVFSILASHPRLLTIAGHMHTTEHHYFGEDEGFPGDTPLHQHVLTTVSGSWWSGPLDEVGIPVTLQRDGTPNGYYIMDVDGNAATLRYKAARKPADQQLRVVIDASFHGVTADGMRDERLDEAIGGTIDLDHLHAAEVVANLFDGGPRSKLEMQIGDRPPVPMTRTDRSDPYVEQLFARYKETMKSWVVPEASSHVWVAGLPLDLDPGVHTITVTAVDEYGAHHTARRILEVVGR